MAEALRRPQIDAPTFYRWEKEAKQGMRDALEKRRPRESDGKDREIERLREEITRKKPH